MMKRTKLLFSRFLRAGSRGKAMMLTVVVALTLAAVTPAFAANGSNFILGSLNNTATAITRLVSNVNGPALWVVNPNTTGAAATAATFQVATGHPPFKVTSATKVPNLNADTVDGIDSTQLQGAKAYAHINVNGTIDASRSKNVNRSIKFPGQGFYCLNSTVPPHNVVATIDHIPGGPGEFGELVKNSANGSSVCTSNDTTFNIVVNTANSAGTAEDRAFDIVIN